MSVFFTADQHFGHVGIIKFCQRPFEFSSEGLAEMNEHMIKCWNERVGYGDEVYVLGDFSFGGRPFIRSILGRLRGRKYLCLGSHDDGSKNLYEKFPGDDTYPQEERFERVERDYILTLDRSGLPAARMFLSHYCHKTWPESHYGVWHLFGHSHGALDPYAEHEGKLLDVGVDTHPEGFGYPYSLQEVIDIMATRPRNFNDVGIHHTPIDH